MTETAASGTTNSASNGKDGKKDSKGNGTASSTTGKQQNTGSTASGGQSTGTTTGGKTNSSATSGSNSSNSNNNQSANNNSGNNGNSNNGNSGNSNTGNSGSGNNGGSSTGDSDIVIVNGEKVDKSTLGSYEDAKENGTLEGGKNYVDENGGIHHQGGTTGTDPTGKEIDSSDQTSGSIIGDPSASDGFGEGVPDNNGYTP